MEEILIPITFFASCVVIIYFIMQAKLKRAKMEHEERMLAMERGIPIPPKRQETVRNPFKWPIIFIAVGIAWFFADLIQGDEDFLWALIPFIVGVGLLYAHQRNLKDKSTPPVRLAAPPADSGIDQGKGAD